MDTNIEANGPKARSSEADGYATAVRRFAFRLLGREMMPMNIKNGDWVRHPGWPHGPVKVIDQNWALRAVAIQLGPNGGIVVWPMRKDMQIDQSHNEVAERRAQGGAE